MDEAKRLAIGSGLSAITGQSVATAAGVTKGESFIISPARRI